MTLPKRRMKSYHPRHRRKGQTAPLQKQKLIDLEHKLSTDVGALLILMEEGSKRQITLASQKAKSDFLKYGPDMRKLSQEMGEKYSKSVDNFLNSVDGIIHTSLELLDDAKVSYCYHMTQKLEHDLEF